MSGVPCAAEGGPRPALCQAGSGVWSTERGVHIVCDNIWTSLLEGGNVWMCMCMDAWMYRVCVDLECIIVWIWSA